MKTKKAKLKKNYDKLASKPGAMIVGSFDRTGKRIARAKFPAARKTYKVFKKEFGKSANKQTAPLATPEELERNREKFKITEEEVNQRAEATTKALARSAWPWSRGADYEA